MSRHESNDDPGDISFSPKELAELNARLAYGAPTDQDPQGAQPPRLRPRPSAFDGLVEAAFASLDDPPQEAQRKPPPLPPAAQSTAPPAAQSTAPAQVTAPPIAAAAPAQSTAAPAALPSAPLLDGEPDGVVTSARSPFASSPPRRNVTPPLRKPPLPPEPEVRVDVRATQPELPAFPPEDSPFSSGDLGGEEAPRPEVIALAAAIGVPRDPLEPQTEEVLSSSPPPSATNLKVAVATEAVGTGRPAQISALMALSRAVQDAIPKTTASPSAVTPHGEPPVPPSARTPVMILEDSDLDDTEGATPPRGTAPEIPEPGRDLLRADEITDQVERLTPELLGLADLPDSSKTPVIEGTDISNKTPPDLAAPAALAEAVPDAKPAKGDEPVPVALQESEASPKELLTRSRPLHAAVTQPLPLIPATPGQAPAPSTSPTEDRPERPTRRRTPALGVPIEPPSAPEPAQAVPLPLKEEPLGTEPTGPVIREQRIEPQKGVRPDTTEPIRTGGEPSVRIARREPSLPPPPPSSTGTPPRLEVEPQQPPEDRPQRELSGRKPAISPAVPPPVPQPTTLSGATTGPKQTGGTPVSRVGAGPSAPPPIPVISPTAPTGPAALLNQLSGPAPAAPLPPTSSGPSAPPPPPAAPPPLPTQAAAVPPPVPAIPPPPPTTPATAPRATTTPPPPPTPAQQPPPLPTSPAAIAEEKRKRRRGKQWFEEIFDEDYLRTLPYLTPRQTEQEVNFIVESLEPAAGHKLLDIGCGYGRHAMDLAARGYRPVGLDLSLPLLLRAADAARRVGVNVDFVHGDMREMTFENEFDSAYCFFTTFGFFDDDTNRKVAASISRALKPGGRFLLDLINRDYLIGDLPARVWWQGDGCMVLEEVDFNYFTSRLQVQRQIILEDGRQLEQEISIRTYSLHEIGKLLHHAGFRVLEISGGMSLRGRFYGADSRQMLVLAEKRGSGEP